jgi:5-methylthioribose kinase
MPVEKREKIAQFLTNTAMCKISEDLIFDEPYYNAPMNRHTAPQLDDIAAKFRKDIELKLAVQELKNKFMNNAEALLHGDLHTGSIMVTESETRVIDPEFSFYGPMGFDIGAILANLFMSYYAQDGHKPGNKDQWILEQATKLWETFTGEFEQLWDDRITSKGELLNPRLYNDSPELKGTALQARFAAIFEDALGYAGCKMIRRILGLAHVEDFESIADNEKRAACERKALECARKLILTRTSLKTMNDVLKVVA